MKNKLFSALFCILIAGVMVAQEPKPAPSAPAASANDPMELVKQARQLNNQGKQDEALAMFEQAAKAKPELYEAHLGMGTTLDLLGRYDEARRHIEKAIELVPPESRIQALKAMAISYAFQRKAAEAAKYEQQAFDAQMSQNKTDDAAGTADEQARIFLESGDVANAEKWYSLGHQTAMKKPEMKDTEKALWDFRWENALARIAARKGKKDEAQKHVTAAKLALDKTNNPDQMIFFPYLTGYVALYTGDTAGAITDLKQANQKDPFILLLLAQAYEKSRDAAQAKELYKAILAFNQHNPTNAFARPVAREKSK